MLSPTRAVAEAYRRSFAPALWPLGIFTGTLLPLLLLGAHAVAQQPPPNLADASLEELGNIQVYSASEHMQSEHEAPSSVTVITADEIQRYGYRNLADILRSVPGFYITYDRDYAFIGVRGFGRLGDWNSRVLLLIDGHRINNNVLGQAMIGNEFLVDVDLIERVEIVPGPSSSLYGTDAFFAVINVITRTSAQVKNWELSFQPGSFGTYEGRATYGHQFHGLGVLLSGALFTTVRGRRCSFPSSTVPPRTTASPAARTMNHTSTFWQPSRFTGSRYRDCSVRAIRESRRPISEPYSAILTTTTLTAINT